MRKWLISISAVPAALIGLTAAAQVAPDRPPQAVNPDTTFKYQAYIGFSYTSLNQVNQSRYGLVGGNAEVSRNFGRFFAVVADGAYYPASLGSGNPGDPSVYMFLFGPELHAQVFENWNVFARGLLGGEHTGGEDMTPDISFAGGAGMGVEHTFGRRWGIRASGDYIGSSFSVRNNSPELGYSPHRRFNARAGVGVVYRF